jgi:hypothetical protein
MYPDPHAFKPERFLVDGKLNPAVLDPIAAAFGYGRRYIAFPDPIATQLTFETYPGSVPGNTWRAHPSGSQ